jgi:hypothetical protein
MKEAVPHYRKDAEYRLEKKQYLCDEKKQS